MALTAVISVAEASAGPKQTVTAVCTISNSGLSAATVVGVRPTASPSGSTKESVSFNAGQPPTGPGCDVTVPAGGSLVMAWGMVGFMPQANGAESEYDIGAVINFADGQEIEATVDTLSIIGNAEASED